jgi:hypothetical protein
VIRKKGIDFTSNPGKAQHLRPSIYKIPLEFVDFGIVVLWLIRLLVFWSLLPGMTFSLLYFVMLLLFVRGHEMVLFVLPLLEFLSGMSYFCRLQEYS